MQIIRYRSNNSSVYRLEDLLTNIGYEVVVSNYFGKDTHEAIKDFQLKNSLVVDGIVGSKTWSKLFEAEMRFMANNDKLLSEQDLINVANDLNIELPIIKAVNEVESSGNGFLINGWPKILFEGHWFWRLLVQKGFNPKEFQTDNNRDVLYETWGERNYLGGMKEHFKLQKASEMNLDKAFSDAAHEACSWGAFQIMGFHAKDIGYGNVENFVTQMKKNEGEHLNAFKNFIIQKDLVKYLKVKDWRNFTRRYNGSGQVDSYSAKLERAYNRYRTL